MQLVHRFVRIRFFILFTITSLIATPLLASAVSSDSRGRVERPSRDAMSLPRSVDTRQQTSTEQVTTSRSDTAPTPTEQVSEVTSALSLDASVQSGRNRGGRIDRSTITIAHPQTPNARQQINSISAYLDGSVVYGSDSARAAAIRTFTGGLLKTSAGNLPPFNTDGFQNANDAHIVPDNQLFLAGDIRANENVELSAVHTLFIREHNRIAGVLAAKNPALSDEQLYQLARQMVIAELQVITYKEFLPALLGDDALKPYTGYNPNVNAGIATEFSTAAYRIGHTLVNDDVEFLDNDSHDVRPEIPLAQAFFNPATIEEVGADPILKYLMTDNAQEVDLGLIDGLRNFLFGPPGAGGMDLASLNIQRGRDHGLPDYNTVRKAYGLPGVTDFSDITSNVTVQNNLRSLYGNVNNIDLWVGGLAEDHVPGTSVGPTFRKIIADQFERVRDGDRFWYQRIFSGETLTSLENTHLCDIIRANTSLTTMQDNAFYYSETAYLPTKYATTTWVGQINDVNGWLNNVRTLDGSGNNVSHPTWGMAGEDLLRVAGSAYSDGVSSPAGANRPSPRVISNTLDAQAVEVRNSRIMSDWIYAWGQFIDHDLDLTQTGSESFNISVPQGDQYFDPFNTGTQVIPLNRSKFDPATGIWPPSRGR